MKSRILYSILSWLGRKLYGLRLQLEDLQYYIDRKAVESLLEEQ